MEKWQLQQMQGLPLELKILKTEQRIKEWYEAFDGDVYVSFSGGKDSSVLLDIARNLYKDIEGVFVDTGLEYPELKKYVNTYTNINIIKPKMSFVEVIKRYGYPAISKKNARAIRDLRNPTDKNINVRNLYLTGYTRKGVQCPSRKLAKKWYKMIDAPFNISEQCCDVMKKNPLKSYEKNGKKAIIGTMACEGQMREKEYLKNGCNGFDLKRQHSSPLSFWTEQDILEYITIKKLKISSVYGDIKKENGKYYTTGVNRTGCMFCMFGVHLEKGENRFQQMKRTHPALHKYCIEKLGCGEVLDFINVPYE